MPVDIQKTWPSLAGFVILVVAAIAVGQSFGPGEWYESLARPAAAPPNWVFGPVWTVLYAMIAIAGWRLWLADRRSIAMRLWFVQLALNAAWSYLFFGLHRPGLALVDITLLLLTIATLIVVAWRAGFRTAAALLGPYWLWVSFAAYLNFEFWRLNS